MTIVRKTAPFGPVILLAADETTKAHVIEDCANWKLCTLIESGSVQVRVVNHEGPWIRDYGPQIEAGKNGPRVVHWRYYDTRQDDNAVEMRERINEQRLQLIEHAYKDTSGQDDPLGDLLDDEQAKAKQAKEDRQLALLGQLDSILANASLLQRNTDDHAAFDIAESVLSSPRFEYVAPNAFVDGGNLMRMGDGRCLTTRTLLSRNKDIKVTLDQELIASGSCSQVIYLDPLPGPVIEHVDMFALPAGPKKVLLASFDLSQNYIKRYWGELTPEEKALTFDAAVAMQGNARRLRELGYEVIEVPAPLPRANGEEGVYYPTVMNALVRFNARGETQILVPVYADYEDDVQAAAMETIKNAFAPGTQIVPIDATEAAKLQGAVHCLTLTLPLSASVFADASLDNDRRLQVTRRGALEQEFGNHELPKDLSGTWFYVEEHDAYKRSVGSGKTFEFTGNTVSVDFGDGDNPTEGTYKITGQAGAYWDAALKFGDTELDARLNWIDADHARIVLEDLDEPHVLVRKKPVPPASASSKAGKSAQ